MDAIIFLVFIFIVWFSPIMLIVSSDRTRGGEKVAWILAIFFISWFAWIFYMMIAPINKNNSQEWK